jgi:hypothetical protein
MAKKTQMKYESGNSFTPFFFPLTSGWRLKTSKITFVPKIQFLISPVFKKKYIKKIKNKILKIKIKKTLGPTINS